MSNKLSLILIQLGHKIKSEVIFFLVNMPIPRMHPKKYTFCDRGGKEMPVELHLHNEEAYQKVIRMVQKHGNLEVPRPMWPTQT